MKVIETERLLLRHATAEDAEFVLELLNDPAFIRNVADRGVRTVPEAAAYIANKFTPSYAQFGFGLWVVELKGIAEPIGMCGLIKRETWEHVDIGYSLLERFWGHGYAYEAAAAVMDYGRKTLGLERIVAVTAPDNESSIRLLEKLGLRFQEMIDLPGYEGPSKFFA